MVLHDGDGPLVGRLAGIQRRAAYARSVNVVRLGRASKARRRQPSRIDAREGLGRIGARRRGSDLTLHSDYDDLELEESVVYKGYGKARGGIADGG